ncbi:MAG: hypothetical protein IZT59_01040 [Verrucomicrobia bacterium]|nr:hypothetical protein [Verrucomicrobiota bacterium]
MTYAILKFVSYAFAWIAPIIILVAASRLVHAKSIDPTRRRLILATLVPLVWIIGLISSFVGHSFHEAGWMASHPDGIRTEEDMMAIGDYPNVFTGWIILGWLPVLVGLVLSKRYGKNRQAEQGAAGQPATPPRVGD